MELLYPRHHTYAKYMHVLTPKKRDAHNEWHGREQSIIGGVQKEVARKLEHVQKEVEGKLEHVHKDVVAMQARQATTEQLLKKILERLTEIELEKKRGP
jgi:hypothetical protein